MKRFTQVSACEATGEHHRLHGATPMELQLVTVTMTVMHFKILQQKLIVSPGL